MILDKLYKTHFIAHCTMNCVWNKDSSSQLLIKCSLRFS